MAPRRPVRRLQAAFLPPFEGIGTDNYSIRSDPPDTNGAVGTTPYVEWVNPRWPYSTRRPAP